MDSSDPITANGHSVPNEHSVPNGNSMPNGHFVPNENSLPNGYSVPNGNSLPNGNSVSNGNSMPNGHFAPNGNSVPNGNSLPNRNSVSNGNSMSNGHFVPNGNSVSNGHSVLNGNSGSQLASSSSSVLAQEKPKILLAACGCVAAREFAVLCRAFTEWADVKIVITKSSSELIDVPSLARDINLFCDEHQLISWRSTNNYDYLLHIGLAYWADILVIAPLSAHTLAKIAGGLCDNLLTSIVRAWDYSKPFFVAPSMDKCMWTNPMTEKHLMSIDELGIILIEPQLGHDYAMPETHIITSTVRFSSGFLNLAIQ